MEQSPSLEADSHSDYEETLHLLWNPNVHYHIHKSLPLVPILGPINQVHIHISYFLKSILILSSYVRLGFLSDLSLFDFVT
jgi:uncharacterized metal-binding protein